MRESRARETRARVKIAPREKRRHAVGREKSVAFSRVGSMIFTCARVSLALLSLRKNGGLLVVYKELIRSYEKRGDCELLIYVLVSYEIKQGKMSA